MTTLTMLGIVLDKVAVSLPFKSGRDANHELLTLEDNDGALFYVQLPVGMSKEVNIEDELFIYNFVQTATENGRKVLHYGHNSAVGKTLAKPDSMIEIAVKSIHSRIEEIVRSSFKSRNAGGEVGYIYSHIRETSSYYVLIILPSLLIDEAHSIYGEIRKYFETATADALLSNGEKQGSFKMAFLIGKFSKKHADDDHQSFRFNANYSDIVV
jgi:hypothetical protein